MTQLTFDTVELDDSEKILLGSQGNLSLYFDGSGFVLYDEDNSEERVRIDQNTAVNFLNGGLALNDNPLDGISAKSVNAVTRQVNVPLTEIGDTNNAVGLRKQIPSTKTLRIHEIGVSDDSGNAPAGLTIEVYDNTNATSVVSQNTLHTEGTPIASKSGTIDVSFRVANATGGTVNANGYALYTME